MGQWGGKRPGAGRKKRGVKNASEETSLPVVLADLSVPRQTRLQNAVEAQQQQQQQALEEELYCRESMPRGRHGGYRPGAGRKKKVNGGGSSKASSKKGPANGQVDSQQQQQQEADSSLLLARDDDERHHHGNSETATIGAFAVDTGQPGQHSTTLIQDANTTQHHVEHHASHSVHMPGDTPGTEQSPRIHPLMHDDDDDTSCVLGDLFNARELQDLLDNHHDDFHDDSARSTNSNHLDHGGAGDVQQPLLAVAATAEPTEANPAAADHDAAADATTTAATCTDAAAVPAVSSSNIRCFYWPCCTSNVCGGRRRSACQMVNRGIVILPRDFDHVKKLAKRKAQAEYAAKRYAAKNANKRRRRQRRNESSEEEEQEQQQQQQRRRNEQQQAAASPESRVAATAVIRVKCVYWPSCTTDASVCGGTRRTKCQMVNNGIVQLPPNFEDAKRSAKLKEYAKYSAERYAKQKAKRQREISDQEQEAVHNSLGVSLTTAATDTVVMENVTPLTNGPGQGPGPVDEPCKAAGLRQELINHELTNDSAGPKAPPAVQAAMVRAAAAETENNREQEPVTEPAEPKAPPAVQPPLVAATATSPTVRRATAAAKHVCYYWPFCTNDASICRGYHRNSCKEVSSGSITLPLDFEDVKKRAKMKEKANYAAGRRAMRKTQKVRSEIRAKRKAEQQGQCAQQQHEEPVLESQTKEMGGRQQLSPGQSYTLGELSQHEEHPLLHDEIETADVTNTACGGHTLVAQLQQPQVESRIEKVECAFEGERVGEARKKDKMPTPVSTTPEQPTAQQEDSLPKANSRSPDSSSCAGLEAAEQQQQQPPPVGPQLAETRKKKKKSGHGGKRAGAGRKRKKVDEQAPVPEQTLAQQEEVAYRRNCVGSCTLETEQTLEKNNGCGPGGKRPGSGRKRKRIPEHAAAAADQSMAQQEQHSLQDENGNTDDSSGGDTHQVDAEQQQVAPRFTEAPNKTVGCGHGGKRAGAGRKKKKKRSLASPLEHTLAQHKSPSLPILQPTHNNTEVAVDHMTTLGTEAQLQQLQLHESEELILEERLPDNHTEPVVVETVVPLNGTVPQTQKPENSTVENSMLSNDPDRTCTDTVENVGRTTLTDSNRGLDLSIEYGPPELPKHTVELTANSVGKRASTQVQPASEAPASPSKSVAAATVILRKRCYYWPCCTDDASICGGHHRNACKAVDSGRVVLPPDFEDVKRMAKREDKRQYARELRAAKKHTKQNSKRQRHAQQDHKNNTVSRGGQVNGQSSTREQAIARCKGTSHLQTDNKTIERDVLADETRRSLEAKQPADGPPSIDDHVLEPSIPVKPPQEPPEHELTTNSVDFHARSHDRVPQSTMATTAGTKSPAENATATDITTAVAFRNKCYYWPCCTENASVCGGHHRNECSAVESGRVVLPSNFEDVKRMAKREEKKKYAVELRAAKKKQRKPRKATKP